MEKVVDAKGCTEGFSGVETKDLVVGAMLKR